MKPGRLDRVHAPMFNLALTLDSGQVFHWEAADAGYIGTIGDVPMYVEQRGDELLVPHGTPALAAHYFALDHALEEICASFPDDDTLRAAGEYCRGLRILRQPAWECLATFITSSMKQVAHIRQMSRALRERFGTKTMLGTSRACAFPDAARLAQVTDAELRACGLGYRATNLRLTAELVAGGDADLDGWRALPDQELRAQLCELPGVGPKVANCVMLFAYERLRSFPVDVWIERVLRERYFARKRNVTARKLQQFCDQYFGEHGGYAQQYLFHHARKTTPRRAARGRRAGPRRQRCRLSRKTA